MNARSLVLPAAFAAIAVAACQSRVHVGRLSAPGEVSAITLGNGKVELDWSAVKGASAYHARAWKNGVAGAPYHDEIVSTNTWTQVFLPGDSLFFQVTALSGGAESGASATVTAVARNSAILSDRPIATLAPPNAPAGAKFGAAIAAGDVDGDGLDDLVVGAPGAQAGRGKTMLFLGRRIGAVTDSPLWATTGGSSNSAFGSAVAITDADADGFGDVFVGAPGGGNNGAILFYPGGRSGPPNNAAATDSGNNSEGSTMAACGFDLDADSRNDLVSGAPDTSNSQGEIDRVARHTTSLNVQTLHSGQNDQQRLGIAVACSAGMIAVGSANDNAVDWRDVGSTNWTQVNSDGGNGDGFGASVAFTDFYGQGGSDLLIGAPDGSAGGRVQVVANGTTTGDVKATDVGLAATPAPRFGAALAAFPDYDAANANAEDVAALAPGTGHVLVFGIRATVPDLLFDYTEPSGSNTGGALATGDFDGDGFPDLAVGDPSANGSVGSVYVFLGGPAEAPRVRIGGGFVTSAGDTLVLGEAGFTDGAPQQHACTINWGDGDSTTIPDCTTDALRAASHAYQTDGKTWTLTISVSAADGRVGTAATTVVVQTQIYF